MDGISMPPSEMICPLTNELMMHPVLHRRYGYSCEASAIDSWLESRHTFCPLTGQPLDREDLVPHRALQDHIMNWLQACLVAEREANQESDASLNTEEPLPLQDWKGRSIPSNHDGSDPLVIIALPSPPARPVQVTNALVA
jgi:hypothetical protein